MRRTRSSPPPQPSPTRGEGGSACPASSTPSPLAGEGRGGGYWAHGARRLAVICAIAIAILAGAALLLDRLFPLDLAPARDLSAELLDRDGRPLHLALNKAGNWRLASRPEEVAPIYLALLTQSEDRRFAWHFGVDPIAAVRAIGQLATHGRVVSGASTLTMQVARLLEKRPRTLRSKLIEMARAVQLEAHCSKSEILGLYLTLAPFGGNIEGVRAASLMLLGKEPAALDPAEAALLVTLPKSPTRLRPDRDPAAAQAARDKVIERARLAGLIDGERATEAMAEAVPRQRLPVPALAPHLAARLSASHPAGDRIATTIDGAVQAQLEAFATRTVPELVPHAGLAILVADSRSREVMAYVGGPDFLGAGRAGQIDMVRALRSPGSLLKPFIYGMGFDDAIIHAGTLVSDVAMRFGDYAPENFDRQFHGDVTVAEALRQSLNIPAVAVLQRVGPMRFTTELRRAGARLRFPDGVERAGLPVALGGVAISLWDLVTLYRALPEGGLVAPLLLEPGKSGRAPYRLVSQSSAEALTRILQGTPEPAGFVPSAASRGREAIAFKTGTSYGFRDAWAIGYTTEYTVGIWVGRPDGTPSPDHYGRNTAAPLLFKVFEQLPRQGTRAAEAAALAEAPPPALTRLAVEGGAPPRPAGGAEPLRIAFPPDGTIIDLDRENGAPAPLVLEATGGRRPFTWFVNHRPMASAPLSREVSWIPDGAGFVRITVTDSEGRSASSLVHLRALE